jgi:hypothetical protein
MLEPIARSLSVHYAAVSRALRAFEPKLTW